jgi:hypothetical protein
MKMGKFPDEIFRRTIDIQVKYEGKHSQQGGKVNSSEQQSLNDIQVDQNNLYREDTFTDLRVASLRRLTPVKTDGSPDESREIVFIGQTQLMSQAGLLPVQCQIEAGTLDEAIRKFPEAVKLAVEKMVEEAKEMQRREASRIVVPGSPQMGGNIQLG